MACYRHHTRGMALLNVLLLAVCSWLGKLEAVKTVLVDQATAMRPDLPALAHAYVYLTW